MFTIGETVRVYGVEWTVTNLADMDGRWEVTDPTGWRENLLPCDIRKVA